MSNEQWRASAADADKGYCLPEQEGAIFAGPRPSKPVFWTVWDSLAGRCAAEQVGQPRHPADGGSKTLPQMAEAAPVPGDSSEYEEGDEGGPEGVASDATVESLLAAAAGLHLQSPEAQRQAQLQYLNLGVAALLPRVSGGDRLSMETMVKLQARIASISGLDQPRMKETPNRPTMADMARLTDAELEQIARGRLAVRYVDEAGKVVRSEAEE